MFSTISMFVSSITRFFGSAATPPNPPTNLSAGSLTISSVVITFTPPTVTAGIVGYIATTNAGSQAVSTASPITITGLASNTTYSVTIKAVSYVGQSVASSSINFTTVNNPSVPGQAGLLYKVFNNYHSENVSYDTTATLRTGANTGYTNTISNINTGTNAYLNVNGQDNYSVFWYGYFLSDFTGTWTFRTNSDDGSYVWVGATATSGFTTANALVNNGGGHGMQIRTGTIALVSGTYYPIRIMFGEGGGGDDMQFSWDRNGVNTVYAGTGRFFYTLPQAGATSSQTNFGVPSQPVITSVTNITTSSAVVNFTQPLLVAAGSTYTLRSDGVTYGTASFPATVFNVTTLSPNTSYSFIMTATNTTAGTSLVSAVYSITTLPTPPVVAVINNTTTESNIKLIIPGTASISGYSLLSIYPSGGTFSGSGSIYTISGLSANTPYMANFQVTNAAGSSTDILGQKYNTTPLITINTSSYLPAINDYGQYICVGSYGTGYGIYVSTNYGATFTKIITDSNAAQSAISATGQYMFVACNAVGKTFYSSNYGTSFTPVTVGANITSIACSSDGSIVYITDGTNSGIYYSTNYGISYSSIYSVTTGMNYIECNTSGTIAYFTSTTNGRGYSYNRISNTLTTYIPGGGNNASGIATSLNGLYVYISNFAGVCYRSVNGGYSFGLISTTFLPSSNYSYICCDTTGQYVYVHNATTALYYSSDYGVTFASITMSGTISQLNMNRNGTYLGISSGSGIFLSTNSYAITTLPTPPTSITDISSNNNAITLSFTPPSGIAPITGYKVTTTPPGGVGSGVPTSYTVYDLSANVSYSIYIQSINAGGYSALSTLKTSSTNSTVSAVTYIPAPFVITNPNFSTPAQSTNGSTYYVNSGFTASSGYNTGSISGWTIKFLNSAVAITNGSNAWYTATMPAGTTQAFSMVMNGTYPVQPSCILSQMVYLDTSGNYILKYSTIPRAVADPSYILLTSYVNSYSTSNTLARSTAAWNNVSMPFTITQPGTYDIIYEFLMAPAYVNTAINASLSLTGISIGILLNPPSNVVGTAVSDTAVSVAFTPPPGTSTSFTATSSPSGLTGTGSSSPVIVTGLSANTSYTFTVTATNTAGTSASSAASSPVTTNSVPNPPTNLALVGTTTSTSAVISFTPPVGTVVSYAGITNTGGVSYSTASPIVFSGLTLNTSYTVTIQSVNPTGTSVASSSFGFTTAATSGPSYSSSPTFISGMQIWMDAKDPNNTGVQPANGSTISTWYDKSGGGRNATANNTISYNTSGLSAGYPALTFSAGTPRWLTGSVSITSNVLTILIVGYFDSGSGGAVRWIAFSSGNGVNDYNNGSFLGILRQSNTGMGAYRNGQFTVVNPPAYSTPYLWETWFDGTNANNTVQFGNSTTTATNASNANFAISYYTIAANTNSGDAHYLSGAISEVFVFNRSLTTTERQQMEGYMSWKWGLQAKLPTTHPYYSSFPGFSSSSVLTAPTIGSASSITTSSAVIGFTAPSGAGTGTTYDAAAGGTIYGSAVFSATSVFVSGLTSNTLYNFAVRATNSNGTSPSSSTVAVTTLAAAPTNIVVTGGTTTTAIISFTPPTGTATITSYTVTTTPSSSATTSGTASSLTISGLSTNIAYTITLRAVNAGGTGTASAAFYVSTATASASSITSSSALITFTQPGTATSETTYAVIAGGVTYGTAAFPATTITTSGLSIATTYSFIVYATTSGVTVPASLAVSVTTVTGPPTSLAVSSYTDSTATVTFTPPSGTITSYRVTSSPGGLFATGASSPLTVTGLTGNTTYTFTATATSAAGTSASSTSSDPITTDSLPSPPTNLAQVSVTATSAVISFTPPAGSITSYKATTNTGVVSYSTGSPITISGLTASTTYTVTIQSVNENGTSVASGSVSVTTTSTPTAVPIAPQTFTSNTLSSGGTYTLTYSSIASATYDAYKAFIGSTTSYWQSSYSGLNSYTQNPYTSAGIYQGGSTLYATFTQIGSYTSPGGGRAIYADASNNIYECGANGTTANPRYMIYNPSNDTWGTPTVMNASWTARQWTGIAYTIKAQRGIVIDQTSSLTYFYTGNPVAGFSALTQTLDTTVLSTLANGVGYYFNLGISLDGSKIVVCNTYRPSTVKYATWNGSNYTAWAATADTRSTYCAVDISPDGNTIYYSSTTAVYKATWTGTTYGVGTAIITQSIGAGNPWAIRINPDQNKLIFTFYNNNNLYYSYFQNGAWGTITQYTAALLGTVNSNCNCFAQNGDDAFYTSSYGNHMYRNRNPIYKSTYVDSLTSVVSGEWLQLQLPTATLVSSYSLYNSNVSVAYPKQFYIVGSNNGIYWVSVDIESLSSQPAILSSYTVAGTPTYSYYRVIFNTLGGSAPTYISLNQLNLYSFLILSAPTIGSASSITTSSAIIGFTAPAGAAAGTTYDAAAGGIIYGSAVFSATSVFISGLTSNTLYSFSVRATNGNGTSVSSSTVAVTTLAAAPTNIVVTGGTTTTAIISFTPPTGTASITSYTVTTTPSSSATTSGTASSLTISGLSANIAYTITLRAVNAGGSGTASAAFYVSTATASASSITTSSVLITFTQPGTATSETTYAVIAGGTTFGTASYPDTTITASGLSSGTTYSFIVYATTSGVTVPASIGVSVTTVTGPPTSLTVSSYTDSTATVSFTPPSGTITSYRVTSSPGGLFATGASSPITVTGLTGNTEYTFTATATSAAGTSASSTASAPITTNSLPSPPTSLAQVSVTGTSAVISFTPPAGSITSYKATTNTGVVSYSTGSPITISGLTVNTTYTVTIQSVNANGTSVASGSVSVTTNSFATPTVIYSNAGTDLTSWVSASGGSSTSSTIGNPAPSIDLPALRLIYYNIGQSLLNTTIQFDVYVGTLMNLLFACNSTGGGNMWRIEARGSTNCGFAAIPKWGDRNIPSSATFPNLLSNTWYTIRIVISSTGIATSYVDGVLKTGTYTIANNGNYIGLDGDGGGGNSYVDNLSVIVGTGSPLLSAPTIGSASSITISSAIVGFTAPAGAASGTTYDAAAGGIIYGSAVFSATSVFVSGLTSNTLYSFAVRATNGNGTSASSSTVAVTTLATAPTNIVVTGGTTTTAIISFTPPTGSATITSYTVTTTPSSSATTSGTASSLTISGLSINTAYTITLRAVNAGGSGTASAAFYVSTATASASAITTSSVLITFTQPGTATSETTYAVIAGGVTYGTAAFPATTITASGLSSGTSYSFIVYATTSGVTVPASLAVSVTTLTAPPTALTVTSYTDSTATVAFTPPSGTITSYRVTSSPGGLFVTGASSPLTVTGLTGNTEYTFTATATSAAGTSASSTASDPITTNSVPSPPTNLAQVSVTSTSAVISFTPPAGSITSYKATTNTGVVSYSTGSPITISGLTASTTYTVTIQSINANGTSVASGSVSVTTVYDIISGALMAPQTFTSNTLSSGGTYTLTYSSISSATYDAYKAFIGSTTSYWQSASNGGPLINFTGFGTNFVTIPALAALNLQDVATSGTGQYITVVKSNNVIHNSTDFGVSWSTFTTPSPVGSVIETVSMSYSGQYQIYGILNANTGLYVSSDYGITWNNRVSIGFAYGKGTSISNTGQYQFSSNNSGYPYKSTDYGVTWSQITNLASTAWKGVALSSNGQYMTINSGTNTYVSSNYGSTWTSALTGTTLHDVAMSESGQYQISCTRTTSGYVYVSTNYGVSFTSTNSGLNGIQGTGMDSTGQYQLICLTPGPNYYSTNYGTTWSSITGWTGNCTGGTVSANGKIAIFVTIANVYISKLTGGDYTQNPYTAVGIYQGGSTTYNNYATIISSTNSNGRCIYIDVSNTFFFGNNIPYYSTYNVSTDTWNTPVLTNSSWLAGANFSGITYNPKVKRGVTINNSSGLTYFFTGSTSTGFSALTQTLDTGLNGTPGWGYWQIAMTPDGSRMVTANYWGNSYIYLSTWNGSNYTAWAKTLDNSTGYLAPDMSLDGSFIIYGKYASPYKVLRADWNGTTYSVGTQIIDATNVGSDPFGLKINPAGDKIIYMKSTGTGSQIWLSTYNGTSWSSFAAFSNTTVNNASNLGTGLSFSRSGDDSFFYTIYGTNTVHRVINPYNKGVFDNSANLIYRGEYLQLQIPTGIPLYYYTLYNSNVSLAYPKAFYVVGSNDGISWVTVNSQSLSSQPATSSNYSVSSATSYTYYRVIFNTLGGSAPTYISLNQLNMYSLAILPAPTIGSASSITTSSAIIGFTAPAGAAAGTTYDAASGGIIYGSAVFSATSVFISGLTSNTLYSFSVRATNGNGTSVSSSTVAVTTLAAAPTNIVVTGGTTTTAIISFTPPTGTATITSYTVTTTPSSSATTSGTASALTISGLSASTAYTITLRAVNAGGSGTASAAFYVNTTTASASAITASSALITFTQPASAVAGTTYAVIAGGTTFGTASYPDTTITASGLSSGTSYSFIVYATTSGVTVPASIGVSVTTVTGPPTSLTVSSYTDSTATVAFTPPSGTITSYRVTSSPGGLFATGASSPITVTGLTGNTEYTFTATATSAAGTSASSTASDPITTNSVPSPPTSLAQVSVTATSAVISFTPPAGSITSYKATTNTGVVSYSTGSPITISGLTVNTTYTVTIQSINSNGTSVASGSVSITTVSAATPVNAVASGGSTSTNGIYKVHTFTTDGTFAITSGVTSVSALIVAGGGGGGSDGGGGGGAGGYIYQPTVSVSNGSYPITVGTGGAAGAFNALAGNGINSVFSTYTAIGGGGGISNHATLNGLTGGSGGGSGENGRTPGAGTAGQGYVGGTSTVINAGGGAGGGGAGGKGVDATGSSGTDGGPGLSNSITGTALFYAGGGGGGTWRSSAGDTFGNGGSGVGGNGGRNLAPASAATVPTANRGGGGGGAAGGVVGTAGATGVVIISYEASSNPTVSSSGITPTTSSITATSLIINFTTPPGATTGTTYAAYLGGTTGGAIYGSAVFPATSIYIADLSPTTSYTFGIAATNGNGTGAISNTVAVTRLPNPPTNVTVSSYTDSTATVSFTPPSGTITSYRVTSSPGGLFATGASSPITVTGLTGNTTYTFTATATSAAGTSASSTASDPITTDSLPSPPTSLAQVSVTSTSAVISFTPPAGSITSYKATTNTGVVSYSTGSPITISGLTAITTYTVTIQSVNANGTSVASGSVSVTTSAAVASIVAPTISNNQFTTGYTINLNSDVTLASTTTSINSWTLSSIPGTSPNGYNIRLEYGTNSVTPNTTAAFTGYGVWIQQNGGANTTTLTQSLNFTTTGNMTISAYIAPRPTFYNTTQSLSILVDSTVVVGPITPSANSAFAFYSGTYSALTTGTKSLIIRWTQTATNDSALIIGNITITTLSIDPKTISGNLLWLDSNDATSFTYSSGSVVSQWNDKSGSGYHFAQSAVTYQPSRTTVSNGKPGVSFISSKVLRSLTFPMPTNYSVFLVGYTGTQSTHARAITVENNPVFTLGTVNGNTNFATFVGNNSAWNDFTSNSPTASVSSLCIMEVTNNNTSTGLIPYLNGTAQNAKDGRTVARTDMLLGAYTTATYPTNAIDQGWNGYICEVLIFNSVLSASDRQKVEGYLAWKWSTNTSLPVAHPYYSGPPASGPTILPAPTIGSASSITTSSAIIGFTAPAGAAAGTTYDAAASSVIYGSAVFSATSVFISGLTSNTLYSFSVRATNGNGTSASSSTVAVTTLATAPTNIVVTGGTNFTAIISFTPPTGAATISSYTVTTVPSASTSLSGTSAALTISSLTSNIAYTMTIAAVNAGGTGTASSTFYVNTTSATASSITTTSALITFTQPASATGSTTYTVIAGGVTYGTASYPATTITASGLSGGTPYSFVVYATTSGSTVPASIAVSVLTSQVPPTSATVVSKTSTSVTISFTGSASSTYIATTEPADGTGNGSGTPSSYTIYGLLPGTTYSITLIATSAAGVSQPSSPLSVTTALGPPTILSASSITTTSAVLNITPPSGAANGTMYTAIAGGLTYGTVSYPSTSISVTGLSSNTLYQFTATSTNTDGTSSPSAAFSLTTIAEAPSNISINGGSTTSTIISFTPPSGSANITSYTVTTSPSASISTSGTYSSYTISGLTAGSLYTMTIAAVNAAGVSATTTFYVSTRAATASSITDSSVLITFTQPATAVGSTTYVVIAGGVSYGTESYPATSITASGLSSNTVYGLVVYATTDGLTIPASLATTVTTAPGPPTSLIGTATGSSRVSVAFTPPSGTGTITSYTVTSSPGGLTGTGASSPILITGLTANTAYTFTATATNASGTSGSSTASTAITTNSLPNPPSNLVASTISGTSASVAFTLSTDTVTGYTVTSSPSGITGTGSSSPITVSGLSSSGTYTFTAVATNANGNSTATSPSNSLAMNPIPQTGLVLELLFGANTPPTSSNGVTITSTGSPIMTPMLYNSVDSGYVLNCTNGTSNLQTNLTTPSSFSRCFWIYPITRNSGAANTLSSSNVPIWYVNGTNLSVGYNGGSNTGVTDTVDRGTNVWINYVATYDNATTTMKLYVNGSVVATNAAITFTGDGNALYINGGQYSRTASYYDNIRCYNRALTADEVSSLYNAEQATIRGSVFNVVSTTNLILHLPLENNYTNLSTVSSTITQGTGGGGSTTFTTASAVGTHAINYTANTDAGGNRIYIANMAASVASGLSISLWIKVDKLVNTSNDNIYFEAEGLDTNGYGLFLMRSNGASKNNLQFAGGTPFALNNMGDATGAGSPAWYHLVFVVPFAGRTAAPQCTIYVNNVLKYNGNYATNVGSYPTTTTSLTKASFGSSLGSPHKSLIGSMDDIRIYNKLLSASEVNLLFNLKNSVTLGT